MPRRAIAQENRTGEGGDRFPRIKPQNKGDKFRFTMRDDPWGEWVHYIKAPQFDDDGKPVKVKRTRKGGDVEELDLALVSMPICLGDEETLKNNGGLDPANCPACEASVKSGGDLPGPIQRFAAAVVLYDLRSGGDGFELKSPFGANIKIWGFTGRQYDEIESIQRQIGPLREHDITIDTEEPKWGKIKISFRMQPGYREAPKGYVAELWNTPGNRPTDAQLKDACGRELSRSKIQDDCDFALRMWRKYNNEGKQADDDFGTPEDLGAGLDGLLAQEGGSGLDPWEEESASTSGSSPASASAAAGALSVEDDPFGELDSIPAATAPPAAQQKAPASAGAGATTPAALPSDDFDFGSEAPAPAAAAATPAGAGDFDFDGLMEGLK